MGAEQVELEGVLDRLGLVFDPRRDVQHLAFADRDLFARDQEAERALQDVGHLFALVGMHGHEAATLEVDLRDHLAVARDDLAREHFGDFFECNFVPPMEANRLVDHGRRAYTNRFRML